jgi:predicted dehydrogenase
MRLAFTGTGYISKIHAAAATSLGLELTAVVNHKPESRQALAANFGIARQYSTIRDLLTDGGVDAVVISTPNYLHAPEAIAALQAGVPVMVEKPMALNAAEAESMLKASQRSGALLMVAHCWRFDPEVVWLRDQVQAGQLGAIVRTKGYGVHVNWGPSGWFTHKPLAGGGAMADMGVHALDTARFLLGDPKPISVYARIGTYYTEHDVDDTGIVIVNWDNGATSYFESGWWQPHADGPEAATQLYGRSGFGQLFPTRVRRGDQSIEPGFTFPREPHCPQSLYNSQLHYFIDCIQNRRTPVPGGLEGWLNMKVIDAAYESSRTNRVVELA